MIPRTPLTPKNLVHFARKSAPRAAKSSKCYPRVSRTTVLHGEFNHFWTSSHQFHAIEHSDIPRAELWSSEAASDDDAGKVATLSPSAMLVVRNARGISRFLGATDMARSLPGGRNPPKPSCISHQKHG